MKPENQIKALADLDEPYLEWRIEPIGGVQSGLTCYGYKNGDCVSRCKNYLTSYDAIIPLVQKQHRNVQSLFYSILYARLVGRLAGDVLDATPSQLCEALLRATGKWVEE